MSDHYCCKRCGQRYESCSCKPLESPKAGLQPPKFSNRAKPAGLLTSYYVTGLTRIEIGSYSPHDGETYSSRVKKSEFIVDRTKTGATEQFKVVYPGSTNVEVKLIKRLE